MTIELSEDSGDFHQDGMSDPRLARTLIPGVVVTPDDDVPSRLIPYREEKRCIRVFGIVTKWDSLK